MRSNPSFYFRVAECQFNTCLLTSAVLWKVGGDAVLLNRKQPHYFSGEHKQAGI